MIESFKCRETEKIFNREYSRKLPNDIQRIAFRKLRVLNRSSTIQDLRVPLANRLEALSGKKKGNIASGLTINGEFVSSGRTATHIMLR
jgi:proteic killer suppression protein